MNSEVPTREQVLDHYREIYTSANATRWDQDARDIFAREAISLYLSAHRRSAPHSILDVGCGTGHTLAYFGDKWTGTELYGFDLSPEAIAVAKTRLPNAHLEVSDLEAFHSETRFETVTLLGVLEHFEEPLSALSKLTELLAPHGMVYIEVPNNLSYPTSEKREGFRRLNSGSRQWEWHLRRTSWERLLRESGFATAVSLHGPRAWTQFVWILDKGQEPLDWYWNLRLEIFEQERRLWDGNIVQSIRSKTKKTLGKR